MYLCIYICTCVYIYINICMLLHICICLYIYVYVSMYIHMYVCIYIYKYIYIPYVYICTCTPRRRSQFSLFLLCILSLFLCLSTRTDNTVNRCFLFGLFAHMHFCVCDCSVLSLHRRATVNTLIRLTCSVLLVWFFLLSFFWVHLWCFPLCVCLGDRTGHTFHALVRLAGARFY